MRQQQITFPVIPSVASKCLVHPAFLLIQDVSSLWCRLDLFCRLFNLRTNNCEGDEKISNL